MHVLDLKSEKFWENLKIHAGGDDHELRIQFAPPKRNSCVATLTETKRTSLKTRIIAKNKSELHARNLNKKRRNL